MKEWSLLVLTNLKYWQRLEVVILKLTNQSNGKKAMLIK